MAMADSTLFDEVLHNRLFLVIIIGTWAAMILAVLIHRQYHYVLLMWALDALDLAEIPVLWIVSKVLKIASFINKRIAVLCLRRSSQKATQTRTHNHEKGLGEEANEAKRTTKPCVV
ncbi:hypothetical protein QR680_000515 [Steinernema hermaphroditum]|uniref:Uncharacterized protein n=1 Tax=Steinernema hermaphroditum TaxID=289476 RepID=A0AA39LEE7_9BILA|nr:hypothetical protein QR680_000515 [Steinernema hermaphroditum]